MKQQTNAAFNYRFHATLLRFAFSLRQPLNVRKGSREDIDEVA